MQSWEQMTDPEIETQEPEREIFCNAMVSTDIGFVQDLSILYNE